MRPQWQQYLEEAVEFAVSKISATKEGGFVWTYIDPAFSGRVSFLTIQDVHDRVNFTLWCLKRHRDPCICRSFARQLKSLQNALSVYQEGCQ